MLDDPAFIARWIDGRVRYWLAYLSLMHRCRKTPEQLLMVAEQRARDEAWGEFGSRALARAERWLQEARER